MKAAIRSPYPALAAKGLTITVSESPELIAKAFGVADWNTLSSAVRANAPAPRNEFSPSPPLVAKRVLGPGPHRALAGANHREHGYATLNWRWAEVFGPAATQSAYGGPFTAPAGSSKCVLMTHMRCLTPAGNDGPTAALLETHQRESDNTGHQEPSKVSPTRGDGIADGGASINEDRHCNDP